MIASLVNGVTQACVDVRDRGLAYGDGVFRTLRMHGGVARDWQQHYAKLVHDCAALSLPCPDKLTWQQDLTAVAKDAPDCIVKMLVTRGCAARGYQISVPSNPTRLTMAFDLPSYSAQSERAGVRIRVCRLRLARQPRLAGIKHLNRLENVLARSEWDDSEISEGLLFDSEDQLVGGTASNVFLIRAATLLTPDLCGAGVAGVQRARIIEAAARLNVAVEIGRLSRQDLALADAILLCNSVFGIWGVRQLEERYFQPHALISRLRHELERAGL